MMRGRADGLLSDGADVVADWWLKPAEKKPTCTTHQSGHLSA